MGALLVGVFVSQLSDVDLSGGFGLTLTACFRVSSSRRSWVLQILWLDVEQRLLTVPRLQPARYDSHT
jgi:hypothetical protein